MLHPRRPQAADRPENRDGRLLTVTPPFCASWSASASAAGAVFVAPASSSPSTSSAHDWKREREKRCQNRSASARASVALVTISHSLWKRTRLSHPRGGVRRIEVARAWGTIRVLTSSRCLPFHCRPAGLRKARSNRFALPRPPWFPERLSDFDGLDFPPRGTKMKEAWSTEVESEVCYNGNKSIQSLRVETHARALRHLPSSSISGFS